MSPGLLTLSAVLLAGIAAPALGGPPIEETAWAMTDRFEPLWRPPRGELNGWTIGIDPAGAFQQDLRQRLDHDRSLLTALHLYHLIRAGGGRPVLTLSDQTSAASPGPADWPWRVEKLRRRDCQVCVSIRVARPGENATVRIPQSQPRRDDEALAAALCEAFDVSPATAAEPRPAGAGFIEMLRGAEGAADIVVSEVCLAPAAADRPLDSAARKACREDAERLYRGIARFCTDEPARPNVTREPPDAPESRRERPRRRAQRLAREIWPAGPLPREHVGWFCDRFAQMSITNRSLVYFSVSASTDDKSVILRGYTNVPAIAEGLVDALGAAGIERIRNEVQPLPNRARLGELLFGVCRAPAALTHGEPDDLGRPQTQLLFGEPVWLLDQTDDDYLLHAGDGYWGWVRRDAVHAMNAEAFAAYMHPPRGVLTDDLDEQAVRIPRGAIVPVTGRDADHCDILLPGGEALTIPAATISVPDEQGAEGAARAAAALDLLYTPYVFGGRSPLGLDCSGLMTNVGALAGAHSARDAWQQVFAGRLVATSWHRAGIRLGDQLFFINKLGKVYHTGVALSPSTFVHSAPPCVQISSFDPQHPLYDEGSDRDFFMAKRH